MKMGPSYYLIVVLLHFIGTYYITVATEEPCSSIEGQWHNELGSSMDLEQQEDGMLRGTYRNAVERTPGARGSTRATQADIFGAMPYNKPGSTFGFSVMWHDGESMTSWTGQCMVCDDGEEVLETSWIIKTKVEGCRDKWKSTMIGQNTFRRNETASQEDPGLRPKREIRTLEEDLVPPVGGPRSISRPIQGRMGDNSRVPCSSLSGAWYNEVGSEMIITTHKNGVIRGEYRTAVERCDGSAGTKHSDVMGVSNIADPSSTISLYVLWNNGASITGWAGQCHICGDNHTETLIMTWLLRSRIESCRDNWVSTNYGEATFTRQQQTSRGPRKSLGTHTPREAGEKTARTSRTCSGSSLNERNVLNVLLCSAVLTVFQYFK